MSAPKATPPPPAPTPTSQYNYQDGKLISENIYNKGANSFTNKTYSSPDQQNIERTATGYISNLVNTLPNSVNLSQDALNQYGDAFAAPQIQALDQSYNRAKGQAQQAATAHGMGNSVGFARYGANELEKNRAQGLADIQANKQKYQLDIPNQLLMPYANQFNLINAALQGQQSTIQQNQQAAMQGSATGNNITNSNYQNQLAYNQALNAQNQGRGGLFSFFSGGS
jgi:hypothetical protein